MIFYNHIDKVFLIGKFNILKNSKVPTHRNDTLIPLRIIVICLR